MLKDPVLQSIAELLAYIYDDLILCPLAEERELLMHAGDKTQEDLFHVCRLVFGANMQTAFRKTCAYVANYCDSLVENFDELLKENDAGIMIDAADLKISAVEYLAEHAPVDSIEEKAILHSLAYQSRFCHKHVKKQYWAYRRSFHQKRT